MNVTKTKNRNKTFTFRLPPERRMLSRERQKLLIF